MITSEMVRRYALSLPGAQEQDHWEKPSFRVGGKIFAVLREAEGNLLVKTSPDARMELTALEPEIYSLPPTFQNTNYMLVRMALIGPGEMERLLEQAWRCVAPKRAIAAFDAERTG